MVSKVRNVLIASKLVDSVKERAMLPDEDLVYNDEKILEILNEKLSLDIVDTIMELNEEHLVYHKELYSNSGTLVIPSRAIGSKLRDLQYYWGGSNALVEMRRIDLGEVPDYSYGLFPNQVTRFDERSRYVFYVEGDEIKTLGSLSGKYKMYFHMSPNMLVKETECAKVTAIDKTTGIIQFSELPSEFINLTECDIIQDKSPNKILGFDISVQSVNIAQRTITLLPESIPDRLVVGDWFCFPETSPYANVPPELHAVLAQTAAIYILAALGDTENLNNAKSILKDYMKKAAQKLINNRVEGANRKLKSRHGFLKPNSLNRRGMF